MNDREQLELLELAAKAAGFEIITSNCCGEFICTIAGTKGTYWNPITNDGDALRLAVKLGMLEVAEVLAFWIKQDFQSGDPYAATRRAIVRAAAEIGKYI